MSLISRITAALQAIGLDIKSTKASVGNLAGLNTTNKSSVVAALNEVKENSGGAGIIVQSDLPTPTQAGEWFNHVTGKAYAAVPVTGGGYVWAEQPSGDNSGNSNTRNGNIDGGNASTNYTGSTSVNGGNAFSVF